MFAIRPTGVQSDAECGLDCVVHMAHPSTQYGASSPPGSTYLAVGWDGSRIISAARAIRPTGAGDLLRYIQ